MAVARLAIEVVCALPHHQRVVTLEVPAGTTLRHAVERSRIFEAFPELDPATCRLGVHGVVRDPERLVQAGDRVEIYRPLPADPKTIRRRRARAQGRG
jgi:putative ubiquitin-RnfH superfamily antitoxin RatB of RatAB toxin-antitoxin module